MFNIHARVKKKKGEEIPYTIKQDYEGVFTDFYNTLKNNENINWDFFFYRLNRIRIIPTNSDKDFILHGALAEYGLCDNLIRFKKENFKSAIMHEIFHMSSSVITKKCLYSGFCQSDRETNISIGQGLNEGYTMLLDKRYFLDYASDKEENLKYAYLMSYSIAALLESFVGQDNMEKWYFAADLKSLINYLSEYMPYDDCIAFILAIDNVFSLVDRGVVMHPIKAAISYQYIVDFLGRCYMNLYLREYYQGIYGKVDLKERLILVHRLMNRRLAFSKLKIPVTKKISDEEFHAYLKYEKNKVLQKCA